MMELAAARAAMEEQTARRKALRGEGDGEEEADESDADGGGGAGGRGAVGAKAAAAAAAGSYNKVRRRTRFGRCLFVSSLFAVVLLVLL